MRCVVVLETGIVSAPNRLVGRFGLRVSVRFAADLVALCMAALVGQMARFGHPVLGAVGPAGVPLVVYSGVIAAGWAGALWTGPGFRVRAEAGVTQVLRVSCAYFGCLAVADLILDLALPRTMLTVVFPLGFIGLLTLRALFAWRSGPAVAAASASRMLVVGDYGSATALITHLRSDPHHRFEVVGVCLRDDVRAGGRLGDGDGSVPVLGGPADVREALVRTGAHVVAVSGAMALGHADVRELSWSLDDLGAEMVVVPGIAEVISPRLSVRHEAGMTLLHVSKPRYHNASRMFKHVIDRVGAITLLALAAPILLLCVVAIKLDDGGPVFYRAERIGLRNQPFGMWKFRSMVVGADRMRAEIAAADNGNGVLFKARADPRVTRVGRVMRRYSLDELPQLLNVATGSMSLVGPRPPLREEVEGYDDVVTRRLLVRPGMTGIWQVSGRSDLSWDQSVNLDLSYVENWSLSGDFVILCRTLGAVLSKVGAY